VENGQWLVRPNTILIDSEQLESGEAMSGEFKKMAAREGDDSIARRAETELLYDQPYDRLKRALRAEVNEDAWASLYSTISTPFPAPSTGRIAIKVINHYDDEVLKVFEV